MNEYLVRIETETHEWDHLIRVVARNKTAAVLVAGAKLGVHIRPDWVTEIEVKLMRRI